MSRRMRQVLGMLVALVLTGSMVALSRAPYATGQGSDALLRLSWSGRPERIERCRELSDAELADRPVHMRRRLECQGRPARYAVGVRVDGRVVSADTVTGGGLRGDRAIHMLREHRLAPGARAISVEVTRVEAIEQEAEVLEEATPGTDPFDRSVREREERRRERQEALPARMRLDTVVVLMPAVVVLITYDPSARRLVAMSGTRP